MCCINLGVKCPNVDMFICFRFLNDTGSPTSSSADSVESGMTPELAPNIQADGVIERPADNVLVVAADDPELGQRLINSVVHGKGGKWDKSWGEECFSV